jgi:hypothetical protein
MHWKEILLFNISPFCAEQSQLEQGWQAKQHSGKKKLYNFLFKVQSVIQMKF